MLHYSMAIIAKTCWKLSVEVHSEQISSASEIQSTDHVDNLNVSIGLCMQYELTSALTKS